jgi:hypothetical protein
MCSFFLAHPAALQSAGTFASGSRRISESLEITSAKLRGAFYSSPQPTQWAGAIWTGMQHGEDFSLLTPVFARVFEVSSECFSRVTPN